MTENSRQNRLYRMMQHLMAVSANNADPASSADRGTVVTQQDALTAVLLLAAAIDQPAQAGILPLSQAEHMAEMLMLIREHIKPLPAGAPSGEQDPVTPDLREAVAQIRDASEQTGFHG